MPIDPKTGKEVNIVITDGGGAQPPEHAPKETSQPLTPGYISESLKKALVNETTLQPLPWETGQHPPGPKPVMPAKPTPILQKVSLRPSLATPDDAPAETPVADAVAEEAGSFIVSEAEKAATTELAPLTDEEKKRMPAWSNTDSPGRGVPRVLSGKEVTGGFGAEPGQYFALDGTEVRAVIERQMEELRGRLQQDLRFGIACCYPQVAIRLSIDVTGSGGSSPTNDVTIKLVAENLLHLEAYAVDDQETPADALRAQAGVKGPRKRLVSTGMGKMFADRDD